MTAAKLVRASLLVLVFALPLHAQDWRPIRVAGIDYPLVAAAARIQGTVTIKCTLDASGKVVSTERLNPLPTKPDLLGEAAQANARQWVFEMSSSAARPEPFVVLKYTFEFEVSDNPVPYHTRFIYEAPLSVRVIAQLPPAEIQINYPIRDR